MQMMHLNNWFPDAWSGAKKVLILLSESFDETFYFLTAANQSATEPIRLLNYGA